MGTFRDFFTNIYNVAIRDPLSVLTDKVTAIVDRLHDSPYLFLIDHAKCVSFLEGDFASWEEHARTDPQIIAAYNSKLTELEAEGMLTAADFALGVMGNGIYKGTKAVA